MMTIKVEPVSGKDIEDNLTDKEEVKETKLKCFAESTTCHGITRIVKLENSMIRRIIWTLIVLALFSYLLYQLYCNVVEYQKKPVYTKIVNHSFKSVRFPTITICNANDVVKTEFLLHLPIGLIKLFSLSFTEAFLKDDPLGWKMEVHNYTAQFLDSLIKDMEIKPSEKRLLKTKDNPNDVNNMVTILSYGLEAAKEYFQSAPPPAGTQSPSNDFPEPCFPRCEPFWVNNVSDLLDLDENKKTQFVFFLQDMFTGSTNMFVKNANIISDSFSFDVYTNELLSFNQRLLGNETNPGKRLLLIAAHAMIDSACKISHRFVDSKKTILIIAKCSESIFAGTCNSTNCAVICSKNANLTKSQKNIVLMWKREYWQTYKCSRKFHEKTNPLLKVAKEVGDTLWLRRNFDSILDNIDSIFETLIAILEKHWKRKNLMRTLTNVECGKMLHGLSTFSAQSAIKLSMHLNGNMKSLLEMIMSRIDVGKLLRIRSWRLTDENILHCTFNGHSCSYRDFKQTLTPTGLCYSFNADEDDFQFQVSPGSTRGLRLDLNIEGYNTFNSQIQNGIKVVVHDTQEPPNPAIRGQFIGAGKYAAIELEKVVNKYLTIDNWGGCDKNNRTTLFSKYSMQSCLFECHLRNIEETVNCRAYYDTRPQTNSSLRNCQTLKEVELMQIVGQKSMECPECLNGCEQYSYESVISYTNIRERYFHQILKRRLFECFVRYGVGTKKSEDKRSQKPMPQMRELKSMFNMSFDDNLNSIWSAVFSPTIINSLSLITSEIVNATNNKINSTKLFDLYFDFFNKFDKHNSNEHSPLMEFDMENYDDDGTSFDDEMCREEANHYCLTGENLQDNLISIDIYYKQLSVKFRQQQRGAHFESLISNFGGAMGLCLGISLVTIAEFLEFILDQIFPNRR
ncbi:hypothetical protein SNEBB_001093 [Seison nebaliae]|nr:hypothetical protein SNEBB_001093 [Seison nebaliae]